jgi:hypothetical protein
MLPADESAPRRFAPPVAPERPPVSAAIPETPAAMGQRISSLEKEREQLWNFVRQLQAQVADLRMMTGRGLKRVAGAVADLDVEPDFSPFHPSFIGKIVAGDGGGNFKFKEQATAGSSTLTDFVDGRSANGFAEVSTLTEISGWQDIPAGSFVLVTEIEDAGEHRYKAAILVPPPPDRTLAYVLKYNPTSHAMEWSSVDAAGQGATITAVDPGDSDTDWDYTLELDDGRTVHAKNGLEPGAGAPGPLGVNVDSDGTIGSCVVRPLGVGAYVWAWQDDGGQWWFSVSNNAEAP